MQIRIRHLLLLTIAVAVLFALFSWGTVGRIIIGITLFAIHFVVLTMPIVIFVLAIATSEQVGNQLDVGKNKVVAIAIKLWFACIVIVFLFWFCVLFFAISVRYRDMVCIPPVDTGHWHAWALRRS